MEMGAGNGDALPASQRTLVDVVESALGSGGPTSPSLPPPTEHLSEKTSGHTSPVMPPPSPRLSSTHSRSKSLAGGLLRRGNRLSLSFPLHQAPAYQRHTPSWSTSASPVTPLKRTPTDPPRETMPSDASDFLVALAAQERRVLELKEELVRAENDLDKLKKQWAAHEANKKRNEIRHVEQLQMLKSTQTAQSTLGNVNSSGEESGQSARQSNEEERQRTRAPSVRENRRKVMPGQRHTRTLSLLEPGRIALREPRTLQAGQVDGTADEVREPVKRSTTVPSLSAAEESSRHAAGVRPRNSLQGPPKEILQSGRKIAEDFKDGLWTFLEDLRQATIGDEGVHATGMRPTNGLSSPKAETKQSSQSSPQSNGRRSPKSRQGLTAEHSKQRKPTSKINDTSALIDVGGTFWKEHGVEDKQGNRSSQLALSKNMSLTRAESPDKNDIDDDDGWSNWDSPHPRSPSPRWSSSTYVSDASGSPPGVWNSSLKHNSTSSQTPPISKPTGVRKEEIPWPTLNKMTPGNLKRTASNLMSEWEKSLTPPAERDELREGYVSSSVTPGKV